MRRLELSTGWAFSSSLGLSSTPAQEDQVSTACARASGKRGGECGNRFRTEVVWRLLLAALALDVNLPGQGGHAGRRARSAGTKAAAEGDAEVDETCIDLSPSYNAVVSPCKGREDDLQEVAQGNSW